MSSCKIDKIKQMIKTSLFIGLGVKTSLTPHHPNICQQHIL